MGVIRNRNIHHARNARLFAGSRWCGAEQSVSQPRKMHTYRRYIPEFIPHTLAVRPFARILRFGVSLTQQIASQYNTPKSIGQAIDSTAFLPVSVASELACQVVCFPSPFPHPLAWRLSELPIPFDQPGRTIRAPVPRPRVGSIPFEPIPWIDAVSGVTTGGE